MELDPKTTKKILFFIAFVNRECLFRKPDAARISPALFRKITGAAEKLCRAGRFRFQM